VRGPGFGGDINKGDIEKEETGLNKRVQKDPVAALFFLASWTRARLNSTKYSMKCSSYINIHACHYIN
jgi:hypothetical protein